jgi:hypothetical protein
MSMQAASLEVLEKANLPAPQARAIVQAIEIEINASQSPLATKHDLEVHHQATERDLELHRQATKQDLEVHRQAAERDLELHRQATKQDLEVHRQATVRCLELHRQATKQDLELHGKAHKQDLSDTRHVLELKIEGLRALIHESARDTVWRMWAVGGTYTGVLLGLGYFALSHLKP